VPSVTARATAVAGSAASRRASGSLAGRGHQVGGVAQEGGAGGVLPGVRDREAVDGPVGEGAFVVADDPQQVLVPAGGHGQEVPAHGRGAGHGEAGLPRPVGRGQGVLRPGPDGEAPARRSGFGFGLDAGSGSDAGVRARTAAGAPQGRAAGRRRR